MYNTFYIFICIYIPLLIGIKVTQYDFENYCNYDKSRQSKEFLMCPAKKCHYKPRL